jgi:diguanylate cyclase (GGDEF)-like protein
MHDVTERVRAEAALRESEARVRGAVEASLDALFVLRATRTPTGALADFEIADCNERGATFARTSRDELLGRSAGAVFREARRRGLLDACARVVESGEPFSTEYRVDAPSAPAASWAWLQVVRVGDGVAITARDITAQKASEDALRELALVDELTGVYNRRGFLTAAEREWNRAARERHAAMLVYIDLNGFKQINDTHGHAEGDRALHVVGDVLRAAFRGGDVVGRLGGDEFAILVVPTASGGLAGPAQALPSPDAVERMIRERLQRQLGASNAAARAAGRAYDISLCVGVAYAQPGGVDADGTPASLTTLMVEADERLYAEKRAQSAERRAQSV